MGSLQISFFYGFLYNHPTYNGRKRKSASLVTRLRELPSSPEDSAASCHSMAASARLLCIRL